MDQAEPKNKNIKYIRLIISIIIGLLAITLVAEVIEFSIVKFLSDKSFTELQENQNEYFKIRNENWVLTAKIFYSFLAGIIGGYLTTLISKKNGRIAIYILILIQIISLIWAGFFSDLSLTGPIWMWAYLLIIIPMGILVGYKWKNY